MVPGRFHALTSVNQTEWMTYAEANTGPRKLASKSQSISKKTMCESNEADAGVSSFRCAQGRL
jgi:hypothetical protein